MLKQKIAALIKQALQNLTAKNQVDGLDSLALHIEQPQHSEHGDLSTNLAMKLAKVFRKSPFDIAEDLVNECKKLTAFHQYIDRVEVVKPGFINFFFNWNALSMVENKYSSSNDHSQQKVIIEHTSINPNKAAHIGHLRNSCIGDTMARLYQLAGYNVEIHNYIDDLGNQLADTVVGLQHIPLAKAYHRFGDYCWDLYARVNQAYQEDPSLKKKREEVLHQLETGDNNVAWQGYLVAEQIVKEQIQEMSEFGIDYDLLIWESDIVREGFWDKAFELLKQSGKFIKETNGPLAGCWILKQSETEESESEHIQDKVLVRSNGILTYTAKDIAYHLWKFGLLENADFSYHRFYDQLYSTSRQGTKKLPYGQADVVLNVIDQRQEYPQRMVKDALKAIGFHEQAEQLHHVSYGVVSLSPATASMLGIDTSNQKSSYTMSGRQGIGIKISELVDQMEKVIEEKRTRKSGISSREIAIAAIRYYLLRFGLKTEIVFDMDQATEVSGNTGVYLLYGYTRGFNILKKAAVTSIEKPTHLNRQEIHPAELALLRHMITWHDNITFAIKDRAPNVICNYAFELCSLFNHFYTQCPVIKEENDQKRNFRLWLTQVYLQHLEEALTILGLPMPTEM